MQKIEITASICVHFVDTFIEALRLLQTLIRTIVLSAFLGDRKVSKKMQEMNEMLLL